RDREGRAEPRRIVRSPTLGRGCPWLERRLAPSLPVFGALAHFNGPDSTRVKVDRANEGKAAFVQSAACRCLAQHRLPTAGAVIDVNIPDFYIPEAIPRRTTLPVVTVS